MAIEHHNPVSAQAGGHENIHRLETRVESAWLDFIAAKVRCERTLLFADGVECGRAFRRFLREFSDLEKVDASVTNLSERRP